MAERLKLYQNASTKNGSSKRMHQKEHFKKTTSKGEKTMNYQQNILKDSLKNSSMNSPKSSPMTNSMGSAMRSPMTNAATPTAEKPHKATSDAVGKRTRLVTAESVRAGHPDKFCDQIGEAILDAHLRQDANARVAVEAFATKGEIVVAGEVTSSACVNYPKIVAEVIERIGYNAVDLAGNAVYVSSDAEVMLSYDGLPLGAVTVSEYIHEQSPDIAAAVNRDKDKQFNKGFTDGYPAGGITNISTSGYSADKQMPKRYVGEAPDVLGAGDQGIMVGYATNETEEMMPLPVVLAHRICKRIDTLMPEYSWLRPDGKAQVTVVYEDDKPVAVTAIVVSVQHTTDVGNGEIRRFVYEEVLNKVIPAELITDETQFFINPSGRFVLGGPAADTGLTGRKLAVDQYGPVAHIGGGMLSAKDPTKVDRSGAYAARWVAKHIVSAGLARRCEVQISYVIGRAEPVSVTVDTFGTGLIDDDSLVQAVLETFDLTPSGIIEALKLKRPIYSKLACYGHFGRPELNLPWEETNRKNSLLTAALKAYVGKQ